MIKRNNNVINTLLHFPNTESRLEWVDMDKISIFPTGLIQRTSIHYGRGLCVECRSELAQQDWRQTEDKLNDPGTQSYIVIDCWTGGLAHPHPYLDILDLQILGVQSKNANERLHHVVINPEPETAKFNSLISPAQLNVIVGSLELHIEGSASKRIEKCSGMNQKLVEILLATGQIQLPLDQR